MLGGLPVRDLWLLPLIGVMTLLVMLAGAEVVARYAWPEQGENSCRMPDPVLGFRYRANCSSSMKSAEGPWYTNDYNACGYRSHAACGVPPTGTRRIALIGSSIGEGYLVEYPNTIGARLEADLTARCGTPVEVQNLAAVGYSGRRVVLRMEEALTLRPAAVLLVVTPFDILDQDQQDLDRPSSEPDTQEHEPSFYARVLSLARRSRALTVARSMLFTHNPSVYAPLYLHNGDVADFLIPPFTAAWRERLRRFERLVTQLAERAQASGVPFMLAFVPNQAEVLLAAGASVPSGVDPEALPNALAAIAASHQVMFVDDLKSLRTVPDPGSLYYQVDGHPSGRGTPLIARDIAEHFVADTQGPFADCGRRSLRLGAAMRAPDPYPALVARHSLTD
jgi:hypothetical protein